MAEETADGRTATVKEALADVICEALRERGLTQNAAARLFEAAQPDVSDLVRGRLGRFSTDRLERFLNALDMEIRIQIGPCPAWKDCAGISVEVVDEFMRPATIHGLDAAASVTARENVDPGRHTYTDRGETI